MRYRYRTILMNLASVSACLVLTATVGCAVVKDHSNNLQEPFDAGKAAYDRGHYDVALLDFEPRAVAGDPKAQFYMYLIFSDDRENSAKSVSKKDDEKALKWLKRAVESNYPDALELQRERLAREAEEVQHETELGILDADCRDMVSGEEYGRCLDNYKALADRGNHKAATSFGKLCMVSLSNDGPQEFTNFCVEHMESYLKEGLKSGEMQAANILGELYFLLDRALSKHGRELGEKIIKGEASEQELYEWARSVVASDFYMQEARRYYIRHYEDERSLVSLFRLARYELEYGEYEKAFHFVLRIANSNPEPGTYYDPGGGAGNIVNNARRSLGDLFNGASKVRIADAELDGTAVRELLGVSEDKMEAYVWYRLSGMDDAEVVRRVGDWADDHGKEAEDAYSSWRPKTWAGGGSGFFVDDQLVMTNWHVVKPPCDEMRVPFRRAVVEEKAKDERRDLAILRLSGDHPVGRNVAEFRDADPDIGEEVAVYGYPYPYHVSVDGNFTRGMVSGFKRPLRITAEGHSLQFTFTAPTSEGNSGGPVLDRYGKVVGVVTSGLGGYLDARQRPIVPQNINWAIGHLPIVNALRSAGVESPTYRHGTEGKNGETDAADSDASVHEPMSMSALYDIAKGYTIRIECWKNQTEIE